MMASARACRSARSEHSPASSVTISSRSKSAALAKVFTATPAASCTTTRP
nr:hypothetical protein Beed-S103_00044 [Bovine alphaherpesvirus 5]